MLSRAAISFVLLFLSVATSSVAQEDPEPRIPSGNSPIGIGALYGSSSDEWEGALLLEGANHFKQRRTFIGVRQYGFAQSRLELGTSLGFALSATSGITLSGVSTGQTISPHLGVEPFSGRIAWSTSDQREDFYEWLPMASGGLQLELGTCRTLPLVRAGAALGNLGKSGLSPVSHFAYGAGFHTNCAGMDFAAEVNRISRTGAPIDLATLDFGLLLGSSRWRIGMRAEALLFRESDGVSPITRALPGERSESRLMMVFRGNPFDPI